MTAPSIDRIKEVLDYNPETGVFTWKKHRKSNLVGSVAGCTSGKGYVRICVDFVSLKAHRIAWLFVYGEWPSGDVDHINGNKSDNRICNLRCVTRSENMQNLKRANKNNKSSGLLGVTWSKSRSCFVAGIWLNGRRKHLGVFDDPQVAHQAYLNAKRGLHPAGTI